MPKIPKTRIFAGKRYSLHNQRRFPFKEDAMSLARTLRRQTVFNFRVAKVKDPQNGEPRWVLYSRKRSR